ncbi:MAG TPA: hypothetical protein VNU28_02160 [Solirubrobacteraceae bacterium]|jgi:hypothetical protein|nr:hypothetical protein [Solirubrobacteraceae bacterium]
MTDATIPARTSAAVRSAEARAEPSRLGAVLRHLDLILVAVAVPVTLALGAPVVGVVVSAAAWFLQYAVARADRRLIARQGPNARFGLNLVDGFGRIWLLAGAIVLAAVIGGRSAGLTAALFTFGAYSVAFAVRLVSGRPQGAQR